MQPSVQQALTLATDGGGSVKVELEFKGKVKERGAKVEKDGTLQYNFSKTLSNHTIMLIQLLTSVKTDVQAPPTLILTGKDTSSCPESAPYIAIAIDIDAPYVSAPFLSPIVHWIQPTLNLKPNIPTTNNKLESETGPVVNWLTPIPPPFSGPHRYIVMLYQQPANFDITHWDAQFVEPVSIPKRIRWSLDDFIKQAGLKDMLAANYFRV